MDGSRQLEIAHRLRHYFELDDFFFGTLAPDFLASDSPIAMACFGLVTFRPDPLFSFPCLNAFISRSTLLEALGLYFLALDPFLPGLFFAADFLWPLELLDFFVAIGVLPLTSVGSRQRTQGCRQKDAGPFGVAPGAKRMEQKTARTAPVNTIE